MALTINRAIADLGFDLKEVLLVRHHYNGDITTPYDLARDNRLEFERYQARQGKHRNKEFSRSVWASFVTTPDGKTQFVGLYRNTGVDVATASYSCPVFGNQKENPDRPTEYYGLTPMDGLAEYSLRLFVNWGDGERAWLQRAHLREKEITEIKPSKPPSPAFPGYTYIRLKLSELEAIDESWKERLRAAGGVYVLSNTETKELYVGKADGTDGFWGRWQEYARNGHGGNIQLKSRTKHDYQVAILEIAGTNQDIYLMETEWKLKLQSREMGLNAN
jgi:GIY-YIG catalytic domain